MLRKQLSQHFANPNQLRRDHLASHLVHGQVRMRHGYLYVHYNTQSRIDGFGLPLFVIEVYSVTAGSSVSGGSGCFERGDLRVAE